MWQRPLRKVQAKPSRVFVRLKTIKDMTDVAKQYAHIVGLIDRLEEAEVLLSDWSDATGRQKKVILEETIADAREIVWRTEVGIATLEDVRKKVVGFLKGRR